MAVAIKPDQVLINEYRKKAITAYNRLEGYPRTAEFDRSLRAEVHDALWMLTRQWQFGEFKGEDAGSAVTTLINRDHTVMDRVQFPGNDNFPLSIDMPLEATVERGAVPTDLYSAVHTARYFIRLAKRAGTWTGAVLNQFIGKYRLTYEVQPNDLPGNQLLLAVSEKIFDGLLLMKDISTPDGVGNLFRTWISSNGLPAALSGIGDSYKAWFERTYTEPVNGETAWLPSQLEYQFAVGAPVNGQQQATLVADQYAEGHLDWYSFDLDNSKTIPLDPGRQPAGEQLKPASYIPSPAKFKGMPNPRFWMMEDSKTDLGKIDTSTTGLLHLLLAEFGLLYSNDWFILPYPVDSNTLCAIKSIIVTDVFGQDILIRPAGNGPDSNWQRWALFHHTDRNNRNSPTNLFYVAPAVTQSLDGEPIEQVNFLRDEMANLVWGVETIVPSQAGKGFRGSEMALPPPPPEESDETDSTNADDKPKIKYIVGTTVPHNWTPFIPVHQEGSVTEIRLQRAKMPQAEGPFGNILREKLAPYYVNEEEIGRSGVLVLSNWQLATWFNGKRVLWLGRSKQNGKGEGWSNLQFDQIEDV